MTGPALQILMRNRLAFAGAIVLAIFLLMAALGPLLSSDSGASYEHRFEPPSLSHILGTDYAGRDIGVEIVRGSRDIITIAFATGLFATLIAVAVGIPAGLLGGRFDSVAMLLIDIFLTVPQFPLMAIFSVLFRIHDPFTFGLMLAVWSWPSLARSIRTQVLTLKHKEFIEAAQLQAMPAWWIVFGELVPNMIPYLSVNFINIAKGAITASVGIMLLGLVPLSTDNWGMMLNLAAFQSGAIFVPHAWSYVLSPIIAIILFQYSLVNVASGVEEMFDPRLRSR